ncbi:hypothetical protein ERD95_02180 [Enterobacteriaceae bacterium ML5]|nr:hypothetical protein ERD95_02180 [Enterobacteriaceae bacterium ML5]
MTDTTDTKALQRPTRKHYDWSKAVWMDCDRCGEAHTGTVLADDGARICAGCCDSEFYSAWEDLAETAIKLLEAERQRADDEKALNKHLDLAIRQSEGVNANLRRLAEKAEAEIAALKAKLANPVTLPDIRSEDFHETGWFQHIRYYRAVVRSIQVLGFTVKGE